MKPEGFVDLVVWLFIVAGGLVTAYVSFGILNSQASAQLQQYSVGGAIAGALISWAVLTSVYLQLRGSSNELRDLRNRNEELQHKLIRGAPRPPGFETEVDERQRIVLARPEDWMPKGGTIFDLEMPTEKMGADETFPLAFRCYFWPSSKSTPSKEKFFDGELQNAKAAPNYVHSFSNEMVRLGGDQSGVESLKLILRQFVRVEMKKSRETGQIERTWTTIQRDEFTGRLFTLSPEEVSVGEPIQIQLNGLWLRQGGNCFVDDIKRETRVVKDDTAIVTLTQEDVAYSRQVELTWENPEADGLRSNKLMLLVRHDVPTRDVESNGAASASADSAASENPGVDGAANVKQESQSDETRTIYQEIMRMRVFSYNEALRRIYVFDFIQDQRTFNQSSGVFNQVLNSVRFLN